MTSRPNPFATHFDLVKPLVDFGNCSQEGIDPDARGADKNPCIADQRVGRLPVHAYARCPQERRDRGAHLLA
jgi:hypothetical protein